MWSAKHRRGERLYRVVIQSLINTEIPTRAWTEDHCSY